MNNPMDIWHFLRPILLELNGEDTEMYATVFHALELEEEFQKRKQVE